ncbi:MAG: hypothetical protein P1U87_03180 [Verrucomicrobiales bacterium]|nr:hypothetical protein [Verrucomicrobiales bacterium]
MKPTPNQLSEISIDLLEFEAVLISVLLTISVIALVAVAIAKSRSVKRADEAAIQKVKEALHPEEAVEREKSEE